MRTRSGEAEPGPGGSRDSPEPSVLSCSARPGRRVTMRTQTTADRGREQGRRASEGEGLGGACRTAAPGAPAARRESPGRPAGAPGRELPLRAVALQQLVILRDSILPLLYVLGLRLGARAPPGPGG
eukprot:763870-Hanusia_phi.AAC.4